MAINLKKYVLPKAVEVDGRMYPVKTDFRYWLTLRDTLQKNKSVTPEQVEFIYVNDKPANFAAGISALINFMSPAQELPRHTGGESGEVVIDYNIDADYIYAAFFEQYRIDLLTKDLHWYQFLALLQGLHDTELNRIIDARLYKPSGDDTAYEKEKRKQYEAWRLPQPEDNEPDEDLEEFLNKLK